MVGVLAGIGGVWGVAWLGVCALFIIICLSFVLVSTFRFLVFLFLFYFCDIGVIVDDTTRV